MLVGVFVQCESGVGETLKDLKKRNGGIFQRFILFTYCIVPLMNLYEPVEALFILDHSVYCMCEWINPLKTFIVPQGNAVGFGERH